MTSTRWLDHARRADVEAWIGALLVRWKPATPHNRYRGLHAFYRWLEDEEDIPSPMAKMKPQAVPDRPLPVLGEPQLRTLFAVCAGKDFDRSHGGDRLAADLAGRMTIGPDAT